MKKTILFSITMLSMLSLHARSHNCEEKGFTVTYLMMERENIEFPENQMQEDTNSTEKLPEGGGTGMQ